MAGVYSGSKNVGSKFLAARSEYKAPIAAMFDYKKLMMQAQQKMQWLAEIDEKKAYNASELQTQKETASSELQTQKDKAHMERTNITAGGSEKLTNLNVPQGSIDQLNPKTRHVYNQITQTIKDAKGAKGLVEAVKANLDNLLEREEEAKEKGIDIDAILDSLGITRQDIANYEGNKQGLMEKIKAIWKVVRQ